jgi:hypothetical protein
LAPDSAIFLDKKARASCAASLWKMGADLEDTKKADAQIALGWGERPPRNGDVQITAASPRRLQIFLGVENSSK